MLYPCQVTVTLPDDRLPLEQAIAARGVYHTLASRGLEAPHLTFLSQFLDCSKSVVVSTAAGNLVGIRLIFLAYYPIAQRVAFHVQPKHKAAANRLRNLFVFDTALQPGVSDKAYLIVPYGPNTPPKVDGNIFQTVREKEGPVTLITPELLARMLQLAP